MQVGNYSGAGHHLDSLLVLRIVVVFERHLVQSLIAALKNRAAAEAVPVNTLAERLLQRCV